MKAIEMLSLSIEKIKDEIMKIEKLIIESPEGDCFIIVDNISYACLSYLKSEGYFIYRQRNTTGYLTGKMVITWYGDITV